MNKVGLRLSDAPLAEPQCESLFELFRGAQGVVELGRLLKGNDAGRVVVLRRLANAPSPDLASATDLARSLAHPRLAKVLGIIRGRDAWYIASEYIDGVTLFELGRAVTERGVPLDTAVAVRIVLDTLRAASEAQQLLTVTANLHDIRCIYPESIWIAGYGEVFVGELLIPPLLAEDAANNRGKKTEESGSLPASTESDVSSALDALACLLGVDTVSEHALLPDATLIPDLTPMFVRFRGEAAAGIGMQELISALSELGSTRIASEQQVAAELKRVVGLAMTRRAQKVAMLERASLHAPPDDDATRYFRVAAAPVVERPTTRPPPQTEPSSASGDPSTELTAVFGSIAPHRGDEPTMAPSPTLVEENKPEEESGHPISEVWRHARTMLDSKAHRAKVHGKLPGLRASRRAFKRAATPPPAAPAELSPLRPRRLTRVWVALAGLLALALLIRAFWRASAH